MFDWMNSAKNIALLITALIAAIGSVAGVNSYFDNRYAAASEVSTNFQAIDTRLSIAELKQLIRVAQEEMFFLRNQSRQYPKDVELKDKLKESEDTVKDLKNQLDDLTKNK